MQPEPVRGDVVPAEAAAGFDPLTARDVVVKVIEVHDQGGASCGVIHSVGAFIVEVQDVGNPAPRIGLIVSCPADLQPRGLLAAGSVLRVKLHKRAQTWPKPRNGRPPDLPIRYARTIEDVAPTL